MCGIFGCLCTNATSTVFTGLKRLDYRGHDSWGIGILNNNKLQVEKHSGKINSFKTHNLPESHLAIGHTRWATHGAVNDINAHPHFSSDKSFILAHNGIVENFQELKDTLTLKGYQFKTQTDTEVIVSLIEEYKKNSKTFTDAVRYAFMGLEGRNTIIILTNDGYIIGLRCGSPMVLGIRKDDFFLSSDTLSFSPYTKKMVILNNGEMVILSQKAINIFNIKKNKQISLNIEDSKIENSKVDKEGYKHFMIKEINEAPLVINRIINQDSDSYLKLAKAIKKASNVYTIGSGTAGASANQIAYFLRTYAQVPAVGLIGAEASDYFALFTKGDLIIAPSQSGETADVMEVLEIAQKKSMTIASLVNMPGSMMTRISDFKFMSEAGPEICVLSTKIFVSHLAWGYLIAKTVQGKYREGLENLRLLEKNIQKYLKNKRILKNIKTLAEKLIRKNHIFLLGKGQNLQIIKEGMVKIIEGTYLHAHAIPAGDLKHYAITLMDKDVPVIVVLSNDAVIKDVRNAVYEVKARGVEVIGISPINYESFDYYIPVPDLGEVSSIANIIPLQLLAYFMANALGNDVDKPRNIAKSVTVK